MNYSEDIKNSVLTLDYKHNKSSNLIYLIVLAVIVICFAALPFINITVDSQARGMLRSQKENVIISSLVQGKVSHVNLKNNLIVQKGELLLKIDSTIESIEAQTKEKTLINLIEQHNDLSLLCEEKYELLKTDLYIKEKIHFLEKIQELETQRNQLEYNYKRFEKGYKEDVISKSDYEKARYELEVSNKTIATYKNKTVSSWHSKKEEIEEQIKNQEGEIAQLMEKKKNYTITAPISGTIINYSGVKQGAYLKINETIGEISPDDEIIVECYIQPKDIGFIKIGQQVKLQLDAFNYNQWGFGNAIVHEIDRNITISESQNYFKVRCKLKTHELLLKKGFKAQLKKGMTCTARFSLTERSLWNLLFDKVDDWLNPKLLNEEITLVNQ